MTLPTHLHHLIPGQSAVIVSIGGNGALRRRFAEMGIIKGENIQVERVAPLGDPVCYRIKGYALSLRKEEAALIAVTLPVAEPAHA